METGRLNTIAHMSNFGQVWRDTWRLYAFVDLGMCCNLCVLLACSWSLSHLQNAATLLLSFFEHGQCAKTSFMTHLDSHVLPILAISFSNSLSCEHASATGDSRCEIHLVVLLSLKHMPLAPLLSELRTPKSMLVARYCAELS